MEHDSSGCIVIIAATQKMCGRPVKKNSRCGIKAHQKWERIELPPLRPGQCASLNKYGKRCKFEKDACRFHNPKKKRKKTTKKKKKAAIKRAHKCVCHKAESDFQRELFACLMGWKDLPQHMLTDKERIHKLVTAVVETCGIFLDVTQAEESGEPDEEAKILSQTEVTQAEKSGKPDAAVRIIEGEETKKLFLKKISQTKVTSDDTESEAEEDREDGCAETVDHDRLDALVASGVTNLTADLSAFLP